jgi:hypothetical protein
VFLLFAFGPGFYGPQLHKRGKIIEYWRRVHARAQALARTA